MVTSRTPHREETYTMVLMIQQEQAEEAHAQVLMGIDPRAPGERWFLIHCEKGLGGGFRFETERGDARVSLPRDRRGDPVPLALVRTEERDRAHLGGDVSPLSPSDSSRGGPDFHVPPAIHLGGFPDGERPFRGRVFEILFYPRALSTEEIDLLFADLNARYTPSK
jgi:hypothetical protein